ncbi:MAG: UvrD-helicase domain-containing protein [Planctomycetia bacterium]|nr:UvrD-helicase domain-containing protein [Planctomycetia bacterium]
MDALLRDLTPAQREAVRHVEGPLLILAGPGSGKTRVITHRIAYLLAQGVPCQQILALTFTNKAADEMAQRVERLAPGQPVWVSTFHRFCARLLRRYAPLAGIQENYTIYDVDDSRRALRRAIERLKIDVSLYPPDPISVGISWAKNRLISPDDYRPRPGNALGDVIKRIYPAYQKLLASCNAVDFDDLLLHTATLLRDNPEVRAQLDQRYRFVLVDEYQDTNLAQYAIVRALSIDHPNLAVTGDPDQSIYGWRGANIKNILDFEEDFPNVRVVRLERNYRSTKRILEVAAELIAHNVKRKVKDLYTENGEGEPVRLVYYADQNEEAADIARRIAEDVRAGRRRAGDFAVFYRVNALSLAFEKAFRQEGVPYQMVHGLEFFKRKEIRDVLGYLQLLANPSNDIGLLRVINTPARGIGKTSIERLADYATRHGMTLLEAARACDRVDSLTGRAASKIQKFVAMFDRLAALAGGSIEELLGNVLDASGYQEQLKQSKTEEDVQRLANIEQLLSVGRDFDERHPGNGHLEEFLEETSLVGDTDDWEDKANRVTLMTLHASKGLEFPVVYLVAVEEGLIPHERSKDHPDQVEEERRLMFVAITRAKQELQLSVARQRDFRGQRKTAVASSFLMELPRHRMERIESEALGTSWMQPHPEEPVWRREPARAARTLPSGVHLMTAAELAGGVRPAAPSPEDFHQGMVVCHPGYGLGHVVALSGAGASRKATVEFPPPTGRKQFVLAASPLRPVK